MMQMSYYWQIMNLLKRINMLFKNFYRDVEEETNKKYLEEEKICVVNYIN